MRWGIAAALAALVFAIVTTEANAAAQRGELQLPDGSRYEGEIANAQPNGKGVLINPQGDRFTGVFKDGQLNGQGTAVWANGDRYGGAWLAGKAEGHGVQTWADGRTYNGAWHNDMPNGQGTVTRADGSTFTALFVDGKRQAASASETAEPPPPAAAEPQGLAKLAGKTLRAIDGSTIAITPKDQSFVRAITAADGTVQSATFTLLGNGMGSITAENGAQPIGFFRATAGGIEAQFADGHSESVALNVEGGVSILSKAVTGDATCTAWFPQGHAFSAEERKAAVAAYARRLGVAAAPAAASACTARATPAVIRAPAAPHGKPGRQSAALPVPGELQAAANASTAGALLNMPVRDSHVRPVDANPPVSDSGVVPTSEDAIAPRDERIASNCLKVDSDGAYWGFRNHCGYAVQFAYCLLKGPDEMTACRADGAGVAGSVSGGGFGALFADTSLTARGSAHAFRWVGCRGGAGEVAARLDQFEPAAGRCVRGTLARAQ